MTRTAILTEEEKKGRNRACCRRWHHRMTKERRCQWCGKPSYPDYVNACLEHLKATKEIAILSKERRTRIKREKGLCVCCGKRVATVGYDNCALCRSKRSAYYRRRRDIKSAEKFDAIVDLDLITTSETSEMIGVTKPEIFRLVERGMLRIRGGSSGKFWFKAPEVMAYKTIRKRRMLNVLRCVRCGHEWWLRARNGHRLRCPVSGCRGYEVVVIND